MLTGRALLVALLVAATALFVAGTTIERDQRDEHAAIEAAAHNELSEGAGDAEETHNEPVTEEIVGIDPESPGLTIAAAAVSLGLAGAVWRCPRHRTVLLAVAATMLAFAAFDIREVMHQIDESRADLAILAAAVAAAHLAAAALSGWLQRAGSA